MQFGGACLRCYWSSVTKRGKKPSFLHHHIVYTFVISRFDMRLDEPHCICRIWHIDSFVTMTELKFVSSITITIFLIGQTNNSLYSVRYFHCLENWIVGMSSVAWGCGAAVEYQSLLSLVRLKNVKMCEPHLK